MRYCEACGQPISNGAKFCAFCGEPARNMYDEDIEREMAYAGELRKCPNCGEVVSSFMTNCFSCGYEVRDMETSDVVREYAGELHKCPNCGEVLSSFMVNCPSCGYEIRDIEAADSVQEFAFKLEQIEATKMPVELEQRSFMKTVFGKDFQSDEEDDAKRRFKEQKNNEKANLICNYPVPNTKEDILEFFLLASSNIDNKHGNDDVVSNAWITKLNQIYQKAEILFGDDPEFERIKRLYEKKKTEIKIAKWKDILPLIVYIGIMCFLMALLWNTVLTILIVIAIVVIVGIYFYKKHKRTE